MSKFFTVAAATILFANTAFAGSETLSTAGAGSDWTGFYAGAFVGKVFDSNTWKVTGEIPDSATPGDWENTPAGITLGYNHTIFNRILIGGELDYSFNKITANGTESIALICDLGCRTTLKNYLSLRARAGIEFDKFLVFGTVGYGRGKAKGTRSPSIANTVPTGQGNVHGIVWGFGAEYLITKNLTLKGEYLNADLGRLQLPANCDPGCYTDIKFKTIHIGLNYQF